MRDAELVLAGVVIGMLLMLTTPQNLLALRRSISLLMAALD